MKKIRFLSLLMVPVVLAIVAGAWLSWSAAERSAAPPDREILRDRVETVGGVSPGDRIVPAGAFMLDSESRMREASMGAAAPAQDPVCGMEVDEAKARAAGRVATHQGRTYFFCSDACKTKFQADPAHYAGAAAPAPSQSPGTKPGQAAGKGTAMPAHDPVCGMEVDEAKARAAGRTATYQGRTYFFCSDACKTKFQADPAHYAGAAAPAPPQSRETKPGPAAGKGTAMPAHDPVCGMEVDEAKARAAGRTATYQGRTYFFCSDACKTKFQADPAHYAGTAAPAPAHSH